MKRFLVTTLVFLASFLVLAGWWNPGVECSTGGDALLDAGATICAQKPTTDTAPTDLSIRPPSAYAFGTQDPANLVLAGGMDEKSITVDDYTLAAADEVEITVNGVVVATLIEGVDFDCITSNDVCATALAIAIEALSGASASAIAAKAGIEPDQCGTWGLNTAIADSIAADGAFATSDNGTDGDILAKSNLAMLSNRITWESDQETYWGPCSAGVNRLCLVAGNQLILTAKSTELEMVSGVSLDVNGSYIWDAGRAARLGGECAVVNMADSSGFVIVCDQMEVSGDAHFKGDLSLYTSNGKLKLRDGTFLQLGSAGSDFLMQWGTDQTVDHVVESLSASGRIHLIEDVANFAMDWGHANPANPTLIIQSASSTAAHNIQVAHDQTNGVIATEAGDIHLVPAAGSYVTTSVDAYSSLWYHGATVTTTIGTQSVFVKFTDYENTGPEDPNGAAVGDPVTDDDITIANAGTYEVSIGSTFANSTAAQDMQISVKRVLATPLVVTDATNATPIVVTIDAAHNLLNGDMVTISGVGGNGAANGDFAVSNKAPTTFELEDLEHADVAGTGAYTTGGTVDATYPGNITISRRVSLTDLGRGAASGDCILAAGDILETAIANTDGTGNLVVTQMSMRVKRIQ